MVNVEHREIVDYAMPMMKIEQYMKKIHELCLQRKYMEAYELTPFIAVESRVLGTSLFIMEHD